MSIDPILQATLDDRLREIDRRIQSGVRERLRVNQPDHEPTPRVLVPSLYHPVEP